MELYILMTTRQSKQNGGLGSRNGKATRTAAGLSAATPLGAFCASQSAHDAVQSISASRCVPVHRWAELVNLWIFCSSRLLLLYVPLTSAVDIAAQNIFLYRDCKPSRMHCSMPRRPRPCVVWSAVLRDRQIWMRADRVNFTAVLLLTI